MSWFDENSVVVYSVCLLIFMTYMSASVMDLYGFIRDLSGFVTHLSGSVMDVSEFGTDSSWFGMNLYGSVSTVYVMDLS